MQEPADVPGAPAASLRKIWSVAAILYGTLALLFVSMPNQVVSRLDDFQPTVLVRGIQKGAMAVAGVSDKAGVEPVYRTLRTRFLAATGVGG